MTAFTFRMGAGVQGDVTRTHPANIMPHLNDGTNPVLAYGLACMFDGTADTVRQMASGDNGSTAIAIAGITVRPFPTQPATASQDYGGAAYGSGAPSANAAVDVMQQGSIIGPVVGTPVLGGAVYVWCAASSGSHVQGGFEASATGGSTVPVSNAYFNGPPDANGLGEIVLRA